jgi:hypothetical protein
MDRPRRPDLLESDRRHVAARYRAVVQHNAMRPRIRRRGLTRAHARAFPLCTTQQPKPSPPSRQRFPEAGPRGVPPHPRGNGNGFASGETRAWMLARSVSASHARARASEGPHPRKSPRRAGPFGGRGLDARALCLSLTRARAQARDPTPGSRRGVRVPSGAERRLRALSRLHARARGEASGAASRRASPSKQQRRGTESQWRRSRGYLMLVVFPCSWTSRWFCGLPISVMVRAPVNEPAVVG